jgi:hypothetical protein
MVPLGHKGRMVPPTLGVHNLLVGMELTQNEAALCRSGHHTYQLRRPPGFNVGLLVCERPALL